MTTNDKPFGAATPEDVESLNEALRQASLPQALIAIANQLHSVVKSQPTEAKGKELATRVLHAAAVLFALPLRKR